MGLYEMISPSQFTVALRGYVLTADENIKCVGFLIRYPFLPSSKRGLVPISKFEILINILTDHDYYCFKYPHIYHHFQENLLFT